MKRLPDTELEVMKALWASGPDTPRAALDHALAAPAVEAYLFHFTNSLSMAF